MLSLNENRKVWKNWSGAVRSTPKHIVYPAAVDDIMSLVRSCAKEGKGIRVIGAGHSFTPLVRTDDVLLSLDHLAGVEPVDESSRSVWIWAGTRLRDISEALHRQGWAQENLGDIDIQSIGGAIGTGTHGTGIRFGSLSTQLLEAQVITASGELLTCSEEENRELFKALQVSLGMLGIVVKVRIRVVPRTVLHYKSMRLTVDECFGRLAEFRDDHDHFEFFWFPHTDTVQVKLLDETDETPSESRFWQQANQLVMENAFFGMLSAGCRILPGLCKPVSRLSARFVPTGEDTAYSHELFATQRLVRFNEMEYSVPAEKMEEVVREIRAKVAAEKHAVHFPVECRYVKGDDIWLSPACGRDSAYIAVHMYKGMEHRTYFRDIEDIFRRYDGRPHWGKMHTRTAEELSGLYPKWDAFQEIRRQLDPLGIFQNDYLKKLFAVK
ncbi:MULTISPECIES: D-arabinono-1,4-lactone oxidase [Paenibacillus]|uniref:FAD-binding oxidoreductase n=1 Tax=Paenibacillus albilobatus TaxID=2716884 RepID=A0A919XNT1_9BACL|nr:MULTISPECIES: D-arabinono-1,4-lactone oxidase [Paenibacillus]GIO34808.1 FAD-binding oxidoreductase [Paenibacillus albilobatus]